MSLSVLSGAAKRETWQRIQAEHPELAELLQAMDRDPGCRSLVETFQAEVLIESLDSR